MNFEVGNTIRYIFPQSTKSNTNVFIGIIEFVGDTFFRAIDENKVVLKVSFKNFNNVEVIEKQNQLQFSAN